MKMPSKFWAIVLLVAALLVGGMAVASGVNRGVSLGQQDCRAGADLQASADSAGTIAKVWLIMATGLSFAGGMAFRPKGR